MVQYPENLPDFLHILKLITSGFPVQLKTSDANGATPDRVIFASFSRHFRVTLPSIISAISQQNRLKFTSVIKQHPESLPDFLQIFPIDISRVERPFKSGFGLARTRQTEIPVPISSTIN